MRSSAFDSRFVKTPVTTVLTISQRRWDDGNDSHEYGDDRVLNNHTIRLSVCLQLVSTHISLALSTPVKKAYGLACIHKNHFSSTIKDL